MKNFIVLILLFVSGFLFAQTGTYTASVRFGNGAPAFTPSVSKKESMMYYDNTNKRFWTYNGTTWEMEAIEYFNGVPANSVDPKVKFGIDTNNVQPTIYLRKNSVWAALPLANGTFGSNITLNIAAGKTFGKYSNGQTIPANGKTALEVITDALSEAIPPTYTAPTIVLNTPATANFEIGSAVNNTLTSTFTQNNAGTLSSVQYKRDGTNISSTDNLASLTTQVCYSVVATYAQGACLNNNLGSQDCTGRITAGTVTSANKCLTPLPAKYYGFQASATPTDANIRGLTNVLSSTLGTLSQTFGAQSSTYLVYAYPASYADLTSFNINGFESLSSFTLTTRSFVNASGYSQTYKIYVSNNAFVTAGNTIVIAQ